MRTFVLAMAMCVAGPAMAQTVIRGEDREVYKRVTTIDMGPGEDVTAEPPTSEGRYIMVRHQAKFASLVRLRKHFQPELEASVTKL